MSGQSVDVDGKHKVNLFRHVTFLAVLPSSLFYPYLFVSDAGLPEVDDPPNIVRERHKIDHAMDCNGRSEGMTYRQRAIR
jgi:hypothetical protein